jgi:CHAD domain-containing protein
MTRSLPDAFLLPSRVDAARLADTLGGPSACVHEQTTGLAVGFFDSFDWRLHQAGLRLAQVGTAQGRLLRLKGPDGDEVVSPEPFEDDPAWPTDLPPGGLRERVAGCLEMRILLPLVRVVGTINELRLLNDDGKTVVRLQVLNLACHAVGLDEPRQLWPRVRLVGVRGYEDELAALAERFDHEFEWPQAPACLFDEAITAVGREAGDYSSKLDVPLRPQEHAVDATRRVLRVLLDTIERNIPGTRADLDSEFLHDLRVATRRTRSALSQVKRVLPDPVVEDFKARFAWVGQITGPVRDLDVFLLELPHYRASLPAAMAHDLDPLEALLKANHAQEQARLKRRLGSPEMRALLADWHEVLDAEHPPGEPGWFADLPIERVAARRIWRMYKRVRRDGRAITPDSPPEAMHELRKDCKKLRYLIEFFRGLYPAAQTKSLIKALKDLLDNLGEFQDLEVQAEKLREFARGFEAADPTTLPTVMAIGALVADLLRRQQAAHERFAACFAAFDTRENRARYERLFKQKAYKSA